MPRPRTAKILGRDAQEQLDLDGLDEMAWMPRCEKTGANIDLHLVAFKDPDTGEFTASVLGSDYRHLVRKSTTLSIPVWALSEGVLRMLEKRGKIAPGTEAARSLRAWMRQGVDLSWQGVTDAKNVRQTSFDLDMEDVARLNF